MLRTKSKFAKILILATLSAAVAGADSLSLITSEAAQNANDSLAWSQLGNDGTILSSTFTVSSAAGESINASVTGTRALLGLVCPASGCSWIGSGFTAQDTLLWTPDTANGGTGPLTLTFSTEVAGAGALIQPDAPGQFTAQIEAFHGTTSLGAFTVESDKNGDAAYIGVSDETGANITSVVFSVVSCAGICDDFALDSVELNISSKQPGVSLSSTALTFGNQAVNTTSASQSVTLKNTGSKVLNITSITVNGDFAQTNSCGSSVAAGSNCSINVTFTPTQTGNRAGLITISDDASGSPQTISLTGTGVTAAPVVTLSSTNLNFGSEAVGTTSAAQSVTLKNTGNATLTISAILANGDFAQANTCGTSVAAGASCTISVTFTPTASGQRTGAITLTDNASNSSQVINLSGTGIPPTISVTPPSLNFHTQPIGITSAAKSVTIKNTGAGVIVISGITITGDFAQTNTCGTTLAVGASCTISVTFDPTATGTRTGAVTILDNATGSPQTVNLTGVGTNVELSPTSLSFPSTNLGQSSSPETVTLTNLAVTALSISSVTISGANPADFGLRNGCPASVAAGASCTIGVTFHPQADGTRTAVLSITDTGFGSPQSVALTGTATGSFPGATLSPPSLTFSTQPIGITSAPKTVTLTNTSSSSALNIASISTSGNFAQTNNCPSPLAASASCNIYVTFDPTTTGTLTGTLTVLDNTANPTQTVPLAGTGTNVALSPRRLTFAPTTLGQTTSAKSITLTNVGSTVLDISAISITGANPAAFTETNGCGGALTAGASCTISVTFHPRADGTQTAFVSISDNGFESPQSVPLSGTGTGSFPTVKVSPSSLTFPLQPIGTTSAVQTLTLQNTSGSATLLISGINISGDFAQTNNCDSSLPSGASCSINVTFTPTEINTRTGTLTIQDDTSGGVETVSLFGKGTNVEISNTSLTFPATAVGSQSSPQSVTFTNVGNTPISISGIAIVGADPADFSETSTCNGPLAGQTSCMISVTFQPKATGTRTAVLQISDTGVDSPQSINLSGTGE